MHVVQCTKRDKLGVDALATQTGNWIKMRVDLHSHPKVVRIASALRADKRGATKRERLAVVGGLYAVWCVFDAHSCDGCLDGYSIDSMDEEIGWIGFCAVMAEAGWLVETEHGLCVPEYEEHNGSSAKRRAMETQRKRNERASNDLRDEPEMSASDADKKRTREEKRREDISPTSDEVGSREAVASQALFGLRPGDDEGLPFCPHREIIELFHRSLPTARQVRDWTPARQAQLRARWREDAKRQNLAWWESFFRYCAKSRFLTGKAQSGDRKPFELGLEWLTKAENFAKVREGAYHDEEAAA